MGVTDRLVAFLLLLLSPALGSFIGVVVDRLPRGESIVAPRSSCRSCGTQLGPLDLVPLVSFALLRGRCRSCGQGLPSWLLYCEISAVGLAAVSVVVASQSVEMILVACVLWTLLALTLCDLLWMRLPDGLTITLLVLALLWALLVPGGAAQPLSAAALGAMLGAGSFWAVRALYRRLRGQEGLGLGDVKLMAGLGALIGPWDLSLMVLLAASGTLVVATGHSLRSGRSALKGGRAMPFGVALAVAGAAIWLARLTA